MMYRLAIPLAKKAIPVPVFFLFILCLCILSGCATRETEVPGIEEPLEKYHTDLEEVMPIPYTPRDDGLPLSPAELSAFKTVSDLDRYLSEENARTVELHFKYFVHQKRSTFERFLTRSARFLPYIKEVFTSRGIPQDVIYLCMVESGGNPNALSPAGAAGLWQFMPFTGKKFGLTQNTWLDERRDPYKATVAASDYLLKLYNDFSDWHLAVAAYNAGEGKIGRAINGTGAADFFELCRLDCQLEERDRLKEETRDYVPRLIAVAKIMRNLKRLGFQEPPADAAWDLAPIRIPPGTNLAGLARHLGLTWDEFSGMNPTFRRTASPPTRTSIAYVPPQKKVNAELWATKDEARMYAGWKEYPVRQGDSLTSIARRHKVSVASLKNTNNISKLPKKNTILLIPGKGAVEPVYQALPEFRTAPSSSVGTYTVKSGDTLFSLARQWKTDVASIRLANRMSDKTTFLKPGQRISIPGNSKNRPTAGKTVLASSAPKGQGKTSTRVSSYAVRSGDTLFSIAKKAGLSARALREANNMKPDKSALQVGQKLTLPGAAVLSASAEGSHGGKASAKASRQDKSRFVVVKAGDSLYGIASANKVSVQVLQQANKLGKGTNITPGQKIVLP